MAYPGGNGISLNLAQYEAKNDQITPVRNFMQEAVGYGALFASEHTSKSKLTGRRMKFYLNPILCPRFQIPEAKTKEPYYWNTDDLLGLMKKAQITLPRSQTRAAKSNLDMQQQFSFAFPDGKP